MEKFDVARVIGVSTMFAVVLVIEDYFFFKLIAFREAWLIGRLEKMAPFASISFFFILSDLEGSLN